MGRDALAAGERAMPSAGAAPSLQALTANQDVAMALQRVKQAMPEARMPVCVPALCATCFRVRRGNTPPAAGTQRLATP